MGWNDRARRGAGAGAVSQTTHKPSDTEFGVAPVVFGSAAPERPATRAELQAGLAVMNELAGKIDADLVVAITALEKSRARYAEYHHGVASWIARAIREAGS